MNMHRDAGRWRHVWGIHPSVLSKGEQRGRRCLFIIGLRAQGNFWCGEGSLPEFPQTFTKSFLCNYYLQILSHEDHENLVWCDLQKRSSCDFLQTFGTSFWSQARLGAIFTRIFRDVAQIFSKSKLIGGALSPPPPTSNTAFHNSITGNFVVYQDRLETYSLQLFEHPENSEWFSTISVIIFEVNTVDEQKQTLLVTIFLFFISFHCSKIFYCSLCLTAAPAPLNMHVVSTNFAKTLVTNLNMTSHSDVTNSV